MIMNNKLRVVLDTTVFCGALVNPEGGNMQCLLLANGPFFHPVIAQTVLAEFVHVATVRGIGSGRHRRLYTYDEVQRFLESLAPLLEQAVPVGLRDILPHILRWPYLSLSQALQNWPPSGRPVRPRPWILRCGSRHWTSKTSVSFSRPSSMVPKSS
ncbi:MAG: PIN domain-containing protein [Firmicutes bacterium]|nr:PIN domain-containing protein [Bacillota bacterium]